MTDATEEPKDVVPSGQSSEDKPKEPSDALKELQDQVGKLISEKHSNLDKRADTAEKAAKKAETAANAAKERAEKAEARLAQIQRDKDEAELEAARDNPELLTMVQKERRVREREAEAENRLRELAEREAEAAERISRAAEFEQKQNAQEVANEYGVDALLLLQLTDGSREKMEGLAKVLPQTKLKVEEPKPDSGITIGGGKPTREQLEAMSPEEYAVYWKKRQQEQ